MTAYCGSSATHEKSPIHPLYQFPAKLLFAVEKMTLYEFLAGECNGQKETFDGSDEVGCGSCFQQYTCGANTPMFSCLPLENICDGKSDCPDGSDEVNCCRWTQWGAWQERLVYNSEEITNIRYRQAIKKINKFSDFKFRDCGRTTISGGKLAPDANCRCPGEKDYVSQGYQS